MKKISIQDLARELGVSKTLVSMVLNGKGDEKGISKDTQARVIELARKWNYKPNQFARSLRLGKSNTLGLIVADISNIFYAKIARQIEDHASKFGYNLMICSSDESPEKETALIQMLRDKRVDGLILSSTLANSTQIRELVEEKFPFVLIDRNLPDLDTNYVLVDNMEGSFEAVEHLIKLGYRNIAQITISPSHLSTLRDRISGYRDALEKNHIPFNPELVREVSFNNVQANVYDILKELISPPHSIQALFVANNNLAMACLNCLHSMKLRVPQDIALISFDDIEFFSFSNPPVTAVAQPIEKICHNAVEILVHEIKEKDVPKKHVVLPTRLTIRQSCGKYLKEFGTL